MINTKQSKAHLLVSVVSSVAMCLLMMFILTKSASAAVTPTPSPGPVPPDIYNYLVDADSYPYSPALISWVSHGSQYDQTTLTVAYGTPSVTLAFNSVGIVGWSPSSTTRTSFHAESSPTPGVGGLPMTNTITLAPNQNTPGATSKTQRNFTFTPPGGFTATGAYVITLNVKMINEFSNGSFYRCVDGGGSASSLTNYSACPTTVMTFTIFVNVPPPVTNASCSFINTPATVNVGQSFSTQVRVNNLSSSTENISGPANPVTVSRQSGPGVTGLPSVHSGYPSTPPGSSSDLVAVNVTANAAGTLVVRAAVANTDNNASCTRSITVNNVENASCVFINTPTTATVGQSFTVQVRVTNAAGSTTNIQGSTHPVNVARVSGPGVSGLPSNHAGYGAVAPGSSINLQAVSVTANGTGTLVIRATVANTDNNANCTRNITVSFAPPEVHCEIAPIGFIQLGQTNIPMVVTAWFTDASGPATSVNSGSIVDASATVGSTAATRTTGMPINNVSKGVTGARTINFQFNAPAAGTHTVNATVVMSFPSTSGGNITENCPSSAVVVGNMPYMKVFGGDIHAGGQFINVNSSCSVPAGTGGVYGFAEQVSGSNYRGASAQLSISSLMSVNEFYSASQRVPSVNTIPPKGLTIANNGAATYGGNSNWSKCIYNFFDDTRENSDVTEINSSPPASIAANQGLIRYVPSTSTLDISGLTIGSGTQVAIYVNGNVRIKGNVTVGSDRSGVTDISELPYLAIIARGNIYVANNVTRIDGLYIAQPANNGSNGKFYTCMNPATNAPYALNQLYANCRTPLRINGSIVARQIRFGRSNGTLNSAVVREYPNVGNETGFGNVAEVFVYTPEMWMAPSPLSIPSASNLTPETVKWQAATSLPPVF